MRRQSGVSLVELMVAMLLGLVLSLMLGYAYLAHHRTGQAGEASSSLQQNGRMAFELLGREVKMAGFSGCGYASQSNAINGGGGVVSQSTPVMGYDDKAPGDIPATVASRRLRGDVLGVSLVDADHELRVESHNPNSAQFKVNGAHDIKDGEVLMANDCRHAAVFQVSNANDSNLTIVHNTGSSVEPGNCSKYLRPATTEGDCSTNTAYDFSNARLYRLRNAYYYIGRNPYGEPALYRQATAGGAEELVEGVEDLQIVYGVDTDRDGSVDAYRTAATLSGTDWTLVRAVRIELLLKSAQGRALTESPQRYRFDGAEVLASDRLLRRVVSATVAIRNAE